MKSDKDNAYFGGFARGKQKGKIELRKEIRDVIERNKGLIYRVKEEIHPEKDVHLAYSKDELEKLLNLIDYIAHL